eukprot:jgi/Ulvmu1/12424/UM009_0074.1
MMWETLSDAQKHLFQSTSLGAVLRGPAVSAQNTVQPGSAPSDSTDTAAAEEGLCHAIRELLTGIAAVCKEHSTFAGQEAAEEGHPPRGRQRLFTYISSITTAVKKLRGTTQPLSLITEALAGVLGVRSADGGRKRGQEDAPDNVDLRLGYGAMLLGKLGPGAHACSLDQLLTQIAWLCVLCWAAVTCIQVLAHAYQGQGSTSSDQKLTDLRAIGNLVFFLWSDVCHGLTQLLQGAVDIRVALGCSMSPDFIQAASEDLPQDVRSDFGVPSSSPNKSCFLVNLLIKLGSVQLEMLHGSDKENAPGTASADQATAPAGLDHFLQALRMATNWYNATRSGRWAGPEQATATTADTYRARNRRCPVTGKIFRREGPQQPLAVPCCWEPLSVEGHSTLVRQQLLSDFEFPHAADCPGPRALPASTREYYLHDDELEAACEADSVELQSFSDFPHGPSQHRTADGVYEGGGSGYTNGSAAHVGWDIRHESYKVAAVVHRTVLPGAPISAVKIDDWRLYLALHDVDGVLADCADAAAAAGISSLLTCETTLPSVCSGDASIAVHGLPRPLRTPDDLTVAAQSQPAASAVRDVLDRDAALSARVMTPPAVHPADIKDTAAHPVPGHGFDAYGPPPAATTLVALPEAPSESSCIGSRDMDDGAANATPLSSPLSSTSAGSGLRDEPDSAGRAVPGHMRLVHASEKHTTHGSLDAATQLPLPPTDQPAHLAYAKSGAALQDGPADAVPAAPASPQPSADISTAAAGTTPLATAKADSGRSPAEEPTGEPAQPDGAAAGTAAAPEACGYQPSQPAADNSRVSAGVEATAHTQGDAHTAPGPSDPQELQGDRGQPDHAAGASGSTDPVPPLEPWCFTAPVSPSSFGSPQSLPSSLAGVPAATRHPRESDHDALVQTEPVVTTESCFPVTPAMSGDASVKPGQLQATAPQPHDPLHGYKSFDRAQPSSAAKLASYGLSDSEGLASVITMRSVNLQDVAVRLLQTIRSKPGKAMSGRARSGEDGSMDVGSMEVRSMMDASSCAGGTLRLSFNCSGPHPQVLPDLPKQKGLSADKATPSSLSHSVYTAREGTNNANEASQLDWAYKSWCWSSASDTAHTTASSLQPPMITPDRQGQPTTAQAADSALIDTSGFYDKPLAPAAPLPPPVAQPTLPPGTHGLARHRESVSVRPGRATSGGSIGVSSSGRMKPTQPPAGTPRQRSFFARLMCGACMAPGARSAHTLLPGEKDGTQFRTPVIFAPHSHQTHATPSQATDSGLWPYLGLSSTTDGPVPSNMARSAMTSGSVDDPVGNVTSPSPDSPAIIVAGPSEGSPFSTHPPPDSASWFKEHSDSSEPRSQPPPELHEATEEKMASPAPAMANPQLATPQQTGGLRSRSAAAADSPASDRPPGDTESAERAGSGAVSSSTPAPSIVADAIFDHSIPVGERLEALLKAMSLCGELFRGYKLNGQPRQRSDGQTLVQFAFDPHTTKEVAIKFLIAQRDAEKAKHALSSLGHLMAAAPVFMEASQWQLPGGVLSAPAAVIMDRGQTLTEWAVDVRDSTRHHTGAGVGGTVGATNAIIVVLEQVITSVQRLHASKYAHRNVKPSNILLRPGADAWEVIDFDCAAQTGTTANIMFSRKYAPPEVLQAYYSGNHTVVVDPATDVWALGIIMFELLTGERAFPTQGMSRMAEKSAMKQAMLGNAPLPWEGAGLPVQAHTRLDAVPRLRNTVLRCLRRDPSQRPNTAELQAAWTLIRREMRTPALSVVSEEAASGAPFFGSYGAPGYAPLPQNPYAYTHGHGRLGWRMPPAARSGHGAPPSVHRFGSEHSWTPGRSSGYSPLEMHAMSATTQDSNWSDYQKAAHNSATQSDALEVALDAMCSMKEPFYHRYMLLSSVERRIGGQGLVQFASIVNTHDKAAIKFYMDVSAFQCEHDLYQDSQLKSMMPATLAIEENISGECHTQYGYKFPPFVIMECGQSLGEWARDSANKDFIFLFQALSHSVRALRKLHSTGYAHRGIKPGNILRRPKQHDWTLIDFGCAAQIGSTASLAFSLTCAPPEVVAAVESGCRTIHVDAAVDIWAIGVIAYELLTGERAFPADGLSAAEAEKKAQDAIAGRTHLPWEALSDGAKERLGKMPGLEPTVLRCLERDPAKRPSAEALLKSWDHMFDDM